MEQRKEKQSNKKNKINNYEQREYPKDFFESLSENNNFSSTNTEGDEMDLYI